MISGSIIKKRVSVAAAGKQDHQDLFDEFCEEVGPANVKLWTAEVVAWESDMSLPDPYFIKPSGMHSCWMSCAAPETDVRILPRSH